MKKIFSYLNYAEFIEDWYLYQKKLNRKYTYQKLAEDAGFKTNSYLIDIIKGRKDLAVKSIFQVATALKLGKREREYFDILVHFNSSKSESEKEYYFNKLKPYSRRPDFKKSALDQYEYYSEWYHSVIRQLVTMKGFKGTPEKIGKLLKPKVSAAKVCKSLELLSRLGLIKKRAQNAFKQTGKKISPEGGVTSLGQVKNQEKNIGLAIKALDAIPATQREISTFTAGISAVGYEKLMARYEAFRKSLDKIIETDNQQDRVYQFNIQVFPVTKIPKVKARK